MSRILTISDQLYSQLESISQSRGLHSIEELLEQLVEERQAKRNDLKSRKEAVARINALRKRLYAKYGNKLSNPTSARWDNAGE